MQTIMTTCIWEGRANFIQQLLYISISFFHSAVSFYESFIYFSSMVSAFARYKQAGTRARVRLAADWAEAEM